MSDDLSEVQGLPIVRGALECGSRGLSRKGFGGGGAVHIGGVVASAETLSPRLPIARGVEL